MERAITIKKYILNKKGFALLYAVFISSMILAIALGVSRVAYKEIIFGTSAKDANDAFYAADTAAECTLFYDNTDTVTNAFIGSIPSQVICAGNLVSNWVQVGIPPDKLKTTFTISQLGVSKKACAQVTVEKSTVSPDTKTTAVGYNNGGDVLGLCTPNATSVQRVLELNY